MEAWFRQHPPNLGEVESVLNKLFWIYTGHNNMDNKTILEQFARLREYLGLSPREYDEVFYIVSSLCLEHAKQAFHGGFCFALGAVQREVLNHRILAYFDSGLAATNGAVNPFSTFLFVVHVQFLLIK